MSDFDANKWFKKQYLTEAGLNEGIQADNIYDAYFQAVVKQIEDSRFDDPDLIQFLQRYKNYIEMDVKSWEMKQNLNEAEGSDIEKIDFAFIDGTTRFYGAYIYKDGGRPVGDGLQNTWNEKLRSSKEVQDLLTSLGIDIKFEYNNLPEIFKALEAQGIKAEDSEFDVS